MVDDLNKTLVLIAILGVVGAFAVGAWLTNFGAGQGVPSTGGAVDPNDWSAAANVICSDTNAEVVDLDQSLGEAPDPAQTLGRGAEILGRRADSLAALPRPSDRGRDVDGLVSEMRRVQNAMVRIRAALERDDADQADRLALGLESDELTRLSYRLDVPWCDLFGADDTTIRTAANINVIALEDLLALQREETGTYAGADVGQLSARFGADLVEGEVSVRSASADHYCVESTVGYLTVHLRGPSDSAPIAGPC